MSESREVAAHRITLELLTESGVQVADLQDENATLREALRLAEKREQSGQAWLAAEEISKQLRTLRERESVLAVALDRMVQECGIESLAENGELDKLPVEGWDQFNQPTVSAAKQAVAALSVGSLSHSAADAAAEGSLLAQIASIVVMNSSGCPFCEGFWDPPESNTSFKHDEGCPYGKARLLYAQPSEAAT